MSVKLDVYADSERSFAYAIGLLEEAFPNVKTKVFNTRKAGNKLAVTAVTLEGLEGLKDNSTQRVAALNRTISDNRDTYISNDFSIAVDDKNLYVLNSARMEIALEARRPTLKSRKHLAA